MDKDRIIVLNDGDGNEVEFEFLDLITYREKEYIVLVPANGDGDEVVILQVETDDEGTESYIGVEDDFVLEVVFALFKERNKDLFV